MERRTIATVISHEAGALTSSAITDVASSALISGA